MSTPTGERTGLTSPEAAQRLTEHGPNELPGDEPIGWAVAVRRQLLDPVMGVLLAAAALTVAMRDWPDAGVVGLVIVLDAALGAVQDVRAARAVAALAGLTAPHATVVRDGRRIEIDAREVVPGDRVALAAGDVVPADLTLDAASALQVDESMLTGESVPVERASGAEVFAGTIVCRGRGSGEVDRTGAATELGRIATGVRAARQTATPLQRQLAGLGRTLAVLVAIVAAVVAGIDIGTGHGVEYSVTIALSLAVAAIPESLPAVVTLSLALAARRMVAAGVLARRLAAVESLGAITVLAADKTGTLTHGRLQVDDVWTPGGDLAERTAALTAGVLCNDAPADGDPGRADPLDVALVRAAGSDGIDVALTRQQQVRVAEAPFDAALARMSTTHTVDANIVRHYCKGSPESLESLGAATANSRAVASRLAAAGRRVLAVAQSDDGTAWALLGLIAFTDPPRSDALPTVRAFRDAGARIVLITGDHPATARAIGHAVGIAESDVYARVRPEQKREIVRGLQTNGATVAMTGDGVNDAPALRQADVGVAMGGRGTEVARQAADLVLVNDELSALLPAMAEGRRAYDNIRRFLRYALSGGMAEIIVMVIGPLVGFAVPLNPGQILWVNLLTHGLPGVAMGTEAAERDVLHRPPRRPGSRVVDRALAVDVGAFAAAIALASFSAAWWAKADGSPWQSQLFLTLTLCQLALALVLRPGWSRQRGNPALLAAVALNVALIVLAVRWGPLRDLLTTDRLTGPEIVRCTALALAFAVVALVWRWASSRPWPLSLRGLTDDAMKVSRSG